MLIKKIKRGDVLSGMDAVVNMSSDHKSVCNWNFEQSRMFTARMETCAYRSELAVSFLAPDPN
jgi:hypothetical protein